MQVIIGIIEDMNKKIEACRVFDTDTERFKDISYGRVKNIVCSGQRVVGLKVENRFDYYGGNEKKIVKLEKGTWHINRVTRLTGAGQPIGKQFNTIIGWTGFAEVKQYYIVGYDGTVSKLSLKEFKQKVSNQEINGASIKESNLVICRSLNKELERSEEDAGN